MQPITWEAIATLSTGFAAVLAATIVALRQNSIVRRQVILQELQVRSDLFERRFAAYDVIRGYLWEIILSKREPMVVTYNRYTQAINMCHFLFTDELAKILWDIRGDVIAFNMKCDQLKEIGNEGGGDRAALVSEIEIRAAELGKKYERLPKLFLKEMRLAAP